jgi:hypothetical protein
MAAHPKPRHSRRNVAPSLSGLNADQVLDALLKVKPADVKKLEAEEKQSKAKRKR